MEDGIRLRPGVESPRHSAASNASNGVANNTAGAARAATAATTANGGTNTWQSSYRGLDFRLAELRAMLEKSQDETRVVVERARKSEEKLRAMAISMKDKTQQMRLQHSLRSQAASLSLPSHTLPLHQQHQPHERKSSGEKVRGSALSIDMNGTVTQHNNSQSSSYHSRMSAGTGTGSGGSGGGNSHGGKVTPVQSSSHSRQSGGTMDTTGKIATAQSSSHSRQSGIA